MNYSTDSLESSLDLSEMFIKSYRSAFLIISTTFLVSIFSGKVLVFVLFDLELY
jgi:hypothetical protein